MQYEVEYHGTYRYADSVALERALARAKTELAAVDGAPGTHVRFFVSSRAELVINASVGGERAHRRAVANALLVLASAAEEGAVSRSQVCQAAAERSRLTNLRPTGELPRVS
jgi:hypothetical protein